ncbi:hypothetical protein PSN45_001660 [Yamadazyma tenuis]|uniref:Uncharacterized protein n=1 Tax=Candida tenuis (strain ATCC 10573 / BCRC 21748 / CBS 615 / JCM 9827 / NBRC 10315 / NRRL Y-1498 / VKM Y-70) TaxID=590646 RepID=G3BER1_CANTC|nr:uncharacterized protein CANTEDRAFT_116653 [Yamadazyma tenuis ATCC 10573]XP_006690416.1 uncharacterized protein CANTEDRAFT_116653 [Yamadazyma tenuis ATCC 10573]EGV61201.1 hypothetical protein CANTEDRAFT_116653 [Yamadazyma tenuis ATCC 10573]EGV61202.1 hypothetical protein CANTEDRAFT_116653 [Yamadazyma tenuis ATCC 10573]WEJ94180.1 hypothetical protein PSN45_001660 [Yamadazyma tenuis]
MTGLGIVLEESATGAHREYGAVENSEILLPPLPDINDLNESLTSSGSLKDEDMDDAENSASDKGGPGSLENNGTFEENQFFYQNYHSSLSTYELDSPSITLDNSQLFPTISNSTTNSTSNSGAKDNSNNTSPLRRLKSFKQTMRKLSLSKSSTNIAATAPITSSTTINSGLFGTTAATTTPAAAVTVPHERPQVNPLQSHFKTLSQDSNGSNATYDSKLKCHTPTTPPFSSPIITLSDKLSSSKDDYLMKIEQNYFGNLNGYVSDDDHTNLMNFFNYLVNEKNVISETFNLTRNRLVKSGWCSSDDLNNLSLQKTCQLNQIDSKLNEINLKLTKANEL